MSCAAAAAVIAVLAVGCATTPAPPAGSDPAEETNAAAEDPAPDPGRMVVRYEDATTAEAVKGRDLMQRTRVLEQLADDVTDTYKLPYDIPLVGAQCDEANDYWSSDDQEMTMCYEDVNESLEIFGEAGDPDPEDTARRVVIASFFHELGHMAIDVYQLPATGREEDVADQLAASVLLGPDDDGNVDPDYVQAAKDQAREYRIYAQQGGQPDESLFADVHTLDAARTYNFECWIYGSDPVANADVVSQGLLPQDRADGCEDEYDKMTNAWAELLAPHLK
ncbi:hypothetical protein A5733_21880 [Mycobacterium sp. NS-7484]|nr:hypothetical protein A5699_13910 [Mycobacterium sp. E802]OMC04504.1 hypothetical protein A5733_21880 [Mycobacterium sp. NS-7484]